MEIKCALCGKVIEVAVELSNGQHVRCPFCKGKFSYEAKSSLDMIPEMASSDVIDPAEMQKALETCLNDSGMKRLYQSAPKGAQNVIKLSFYSTVFPKKINGHKFRANLRALAPMLDKNDLNFLIRFEPDEFLKRYFKGLLAGEISMSGMQSIEVPRRKLGVIRKESSGESVDLNAEAVKRRLKADEEERKENEQQAILARKAALHDSIKRHAIFFSIVGITIIAGFVCLCKWKDARTRKMELAMAEYERKAIEESRALDEERKATLERNEKERLEREQRREEQAAQRQKREQERKAREAAREAERNAKENAIAERAALEERYLEVVNSFRGVRLTPWSALPNSRRPGAIDGVFYGVIPQDAGEYSIYEIVSTATNGTYEVSRMFRDQSAEKVDHKEYEARLGNSGGLILRDGKVYFISAKANRNGWQVPVGGFVPAKLCMGGVYDMARKLKVSLDGVECEISVSIPGEKESKVVGSFKLTGTVNRAIIVDFVEKWVRSTTKAPTVKSSRKTVVFYNGTVIKKDLKGLTCVPRHPMGYDARWSDLAEEARRQESVDAERLRNAQRKFEEQLKCRCANALSKAVISIKALTDSN